MNRTSSIVDGMATLRFAGLCAGLLMLSACASPPLPPSQALQAAESAISNAEQAYAKIKAGASLIQIYSALIFQGFGIIPDITEGIAAALERDGFKHISEAIGCEA